MAHFVFELKLSWVGIYGNLLEWIPRIFLFIKSTSPSIHFRWLGMELSLWSGLCITPGKVFYLTPGLFLKYFNKEYKEKYDFQFCWLGISYRKFIGIRKNYKCSIVEKIEKFSKSKNLFEYKIGDKVRFYHDFYNYYENVGLQYDGTEELEGIIISIDNGIYSIEVNSVVHSIEEKEIICVLP